MKLFYMGRHEAEPTNKGRRRAGTILPVVLAFVLVLGSIALADELIADGDVLAGVQASIAFGDVCEDDLPVTKSLALWIEKVGGSGGGNRYSNGSTVSVTISSLPLHLSASTPVGTITMPANWESSGTLTSSITSSVTLLATAPVGAYSQMITYNAQEVPVVGSTTPTKNKNVTVTANVINCDTTAPVITPSVLGTLGDNGWYTSDVDVSWAVTDPESAISSSSGCGPTNIITDTPGQTLTCSATSAGGTNSQSVTIKRDATVPTISGSRSPEPNGNGWNNSNVTVSFSCGDSLSDIASCGPNQTLTSDGATQSATGTAVDNAGNSASTTVGGIKIDKTPPSVSVTGPSDGATYTLGSVPVPGCITSDALSGVATSASLAVSGGPVGSITATCSGAVDNADNLGAASATYTVIYAWSGFFRPIDNLPTVNRVKAGSAIPVKFSLAGDQGLGIFFTGYPKSISAACDATLPVDAIEETSTAGGSSLSYDATSDQYNYVWKTDKAWANTCRQLQVKLADGTMHVALFNFTK